MCVSSTILAVLLFHAADVADHQHVHVVSSGERRMQVDRMHMGTLEHACCVCGVNVTDWLRAKDVHGFWRGFRVCCDVGPDVS